MKCPCCPCPALYFPRKRKGTSIPLLRNEKGSRPGDRAVPTHRLAVSRLPPSLSRSPRATRFRKPATHPAQRKAAEVGRPRSQQWHHARAGRDREAGKEGWTVCHGAGSGDGPDGGIRDRRRRCGRGRGGGDAVAAAGQRRERGVVRVRGHRHPRLHVPRHGHPRALPPAPGPRARAGHRCPPPPPPPRRPQRRARRPVRRGSRGGEEARQPRAHRDAYLCQRCLCADARTRCTNIHRASCPSTLPS